MGTAMEQGSIMTKSQMTLGSTTAEIPTETHLVMLCLDYLMDLRRHNDKDTLNGKKHLDADYISLAVFALSRSIVRPDYLSNSMKLKENIFDPSCTTSHTIPHITKINEEIMNPSPSCPRPYDKGYNDLHPSNLYRFYRLEGLAAGGPHSGPLGLVELVDAGLKKTRSRCRLEAEKEIVKSTQFELYIQSVTNRGYFRDTVNAGKRKDPKEEELRRARKARVYKERYRKAIAKYREKLALTIDHAVVNRDAMNLLSPPTSPAPTVFSPRRSPRNSPRSSPRSSPMSPGLIAAYRASNNFTSPPRSSRPPFSPPRTFQNLHTEGSMSPLTFDTTLVLQHNTPFSKAPLSSTTKAPKPSGTVPPQQSLSVTNSPRTVRDSGPTNTSRASELENTDSKMNKTDRDVKTPKRYASSSAIETNTCFSSGATTTSPDIFSTAKTPRRFASSSAISANTSVESRSQVSTPSTKPQDSPRSTLAKMAARRKFAKSHRESSSNRVNGAAERRNSEVTEVSTTSPKYSTQTPRGSSGFSTPTASPLTRHRDASPTPTAASDRENKPPVEKPIGKSIAPEIEVKVKAFSLYELNLMTSASSGMEANAGSFASTCAPSPSRQRRKSEYERMIEEQKKRLSCPISEPEFAESAPSSINGRTRSNSTARGKVVGGEQAGQKKQKPNSLSTNRPAEINVDRAIAQSPSVACKSPLARMRREKKTMEELLKLRHGSAALKNTEEMSSPRKLKLVGSQDDSSWISSPRKEKVQEKPLEEVMQLMPSEKQQASTIMEKAAVFQPSSNMSNHRFNFNNNGNSPSFSPTAELKLDPFRINPPSFLSGSKLFAATGSDSTAATPRLANRRLSSPKGRGSPRGVLRLQSPQNNFNNASPKMTRAC